MTIRRKLHLSNILMIVIPVCIIMLTGMLCITFLRNHYFDSLEDMFEYDNGLYSAQSLTFSYWGDFEDDPETAVAGLQGELAGMGFHVYVEKDGRRFSSNLTEEDEECLEQMDVRESLERCDSLTLTSGGSSLLLQSQEINGTVWKLIAVRPASEDGEGFSGSYLRSYFLLLFGILGSVTLGIIVVTNFFLTHWVSHSILKPLKLLQEGASRIEEGDLDTEFTDIPKNEIGEVCRDFDNMRERLKEATLARIQYENYRRELLAGISHDLRTPLTSIKGYTDGLIEGIADTEEKRQRYYRAIRLRAGDMEALADNLSSFTRLETEELRVSPVEWDLSEFVKRLLEDYSVEAEKKNILFLNEVSEKGLRVLLDETEMKRVFQNFFENSVKYRTSDQSVIRLWCRRQEGAVEIRVSDDGPGVPEEELTQIFESFYRGDRSRTQAGNGSGLGLAVAKRIVEAHGGTIWAVNGDGSRKDGQERRTCNHGNGQGLTIIIRLPLL